MRGWCLAALVLTGWHATAQKTLLKTEAGYFFLNYTNQPGLRPLPGDTASIFTYVRVGDSIMSDSRKLYKNKPRFYVIPEATTIEGKLPILYEAVRRMAVGDSVSIYQYMDSAMLARVPPALRNQRMVRYDLVMTDLKIIPDAQRPKPKTAQDKAIEKLQAGLNQYLEGQLENKLRVLPGNLKMLLLTQSDGTMLQPGEKAQAHYMACLTTGTIYDNSLLRGEPLSFTAGARQLMPGLEQAMLQMRHGEKALFFVPPGLAFGAKGLDGVVPPHSEIVLYIEIL